MVRVHKSLLTQCCWANFAWKLTGEGLYSLQVKLENTRREIGFQNIPEQKHSEESYVFVLLFCFCRLILFSCLFFPDWNCSTPGKSRGLPSESSPMKRADLLLPSVSQTVSVKSSFSLNKAGALVFSVLHLLWSIIMHWRLFNLIGFHCAFVYHKGVVPQLFD